MRTWITLITVGAVLFSIVFAEQLYISRFGEETKLMIGNLENKIQQHTITSEDILAIENKWNKSKDIIYVFANHNSFVTLENTVSLMKNYEKNKNYDRLYTELLKFKNCINGFDDSRKFKVSNIL